MPVFQKLQENSVLVCSGDVVGARRIHGKDEKDPRDHHNFAD